MVNLILDIIKILSSPDVSLLFIAIMLQEMIKYKIQNILWVIPKLHVLEIEIYHSGDGWRFLETFRHEALPILRHTRTQMDTLEQIFLNYGSVNCGF